MFGSIGFPELLLIFIVALVVFGPNKLPEFAKSLGKFVREFKATVEDAKSTIEREIDQADIREDISEIKREVNEDVFAGMKKIIQPPEELTRDPYAEINQSESPPPETPVKPDEKESG